MRTGEKEYQFQLLSKKARETIDEAVVEYGPAKDPSYRDSFIRKKLKHVLDEYEEARMKREADMAEEVNKQVRVQEEILAVNQ